MKSIISVKFTYPYFIFGGLKIQLILTENSFKFTNKHYLQTHGVAMGSKMAAAFSVIFVAHVEKQLINASPCKPFHWKRFIL